MPEADTTNEVQGGHPFAGAFRPLPSAFRLGFYSRYLGTDYLNDALIGLTSSISPNVLSALWLLLEKIDRTWADYAKEREDASSISCHIAPYDGPGDSNRQALVALADNAIANESVYRAGYDLGVTLGVWTREAEVDQRTSIHLHDLKATLNAMLPKELHQLPIVRRVEQCDACRVEASELTGRSDEEPAKAVDILSSLGRDIGLALETFEDPVVEHSRPTPKTTAPVLHKLEKKIMQVLDGQALKVQEIADKLTNGESSLLYRKQGLRSLKEKGLIVRENGVGYFRPDSPPQ